MRCIPSIWTKVSLAHKVVHRSVLVENVLGGVGETGEAVRQVMELHLRAGMMLRKSASQAWNAVEWNLDESQRASGVELIYFDSTDLLPQLKLL